MMLLKIFHMWPVTRMYSSGIRTDRVSACLGGTPLSTLPKATHPFPTLPCENLLPPTDPVHTPLAQMHIGIHTPLPKYMLGYTPPAQVHAHPHLDIMTETRLWKHYPRFMVGKADSTQRISFWIALRLLLLHNRVVGDPTVLNQSHFTNLQRCKQVYSTARPYTAYYFCRTRILIDQAMKKMRTIITL